jgi:hypothetical protein
MSDVSQRYTFNLPKIRKICLPKRSLWSFITFAPLISFIFGVITLPGHIILLPYYILVIFARGRPPRFLNGWVYFHSAYLYGAIHEKEFVWKDYWCLYYVYWGFLFAFISWLLTFISIALIIPIFIYVEEWQLLININYRLTFGSWIPIVNECPDMRYNRKVHERKKNEAKQEQKSKVRKAKRKRNVRSADFTVVDVKDGGNKDAKETFDVCPVCGENLEPGTVYCTKCGSYVKKS